MSKKKRRKLALKKILGNTIVLHWLGDALGCDPGMKDKELRAVIEDMITTYADECNTDSFSVNMFGLGKKSNLFIGKGDYRNDRFDEDWGIKKPDHKRPRTIDDLIYK